MLCSRTTRDLTKGGSSLFQEDRRQSNRTARRAASRHLRACVTDPSLAEERTIPDRPYVPKDFACKISHIRRWLAKELEGKTFDEIERLIHRTFETRTFAGRHLVHCHLMDDLERLRTHGCYSTRQLRGFTITADGTFRRTKTA